MDVKAIRSHSLTIFPPFSLQTTLFGYVTIVFLISIESHISRLTPFYDFLNYFVYLIVVFEHNSFFWTYTEYTAGLFYFDICFFFQNIKPIETIFSQPDIFDISLTYTHIYLYLLHQLLPLLVQRVRSQTIHTGGCIRTPTQTHTHTHILN